MTPPVPPAQLRSLFLFGGLPDDQDLTSGRLPLRQALVRRLPLEGIVLAPEAGS